MPPVTSWWYIRHGTYEYGLPPNVPIATPSARQNTIAPLCSRNGMWPSSRVTGPAM